MVRPRYGILVSPLLAKSNELIQCLSAALLTPLSHCHLNQLTINLLQLTAFLWCKHMPALAAYLHRTGAGGEALRAHLDAGCLLAVALFDAI